MVDTRTMIVGLLKSYPLKRARLEQLRFELSQMKARSEGDIIEELALRGSNLGDAGVHRGHISDKTMTIALEYHDISRRMSTETIYEIMHDIGTAEAEIDRIEKYVSLLDETRSNIICQYYFRRMSWDEIEAQSGINRRTLQRHRDSAINELASMYSYISELDRKDKGRLNGATQ